MSACAFDLKIKEMVQVSSGENREDTRSSGKTGKAEGFAFNDIVCVCIYIYMRHKEYQCVRETFYIQRVGSPCTFRQYKYSPST